MTARKPILVGTDFSELGELAVSAGLAWAGQLGGRETVVCHVVRADTPDLPPVYALSMPSVNFAELQRTVRDHAAASLEAVKDAHPGVKTVLREGHAAREMSEAARELDAEYCVIASHGYGAVKRAVLGSVANQLIRISPCPTLIVGKDRAYRAPKTIVAAVDLSPVAADVLAHACAAGGDADSTVQVLSLFEHPLTAPPNGEVLPKLFSEEELKSLEKEHEAQVARMLPESKPGGPRVEITAAGKSPPAAAILEVAQMLNADLIVLGTSGRNALHRFLVGGTASRVVAEAPCPVLVVPNRHAPAH